VSAESFALKASRIFLSRGRRRLINNLSFRIEPGQWLALHGPNGSGKSTLLRALCGLRSFDQEPELSFNGQAIDSLARCSGIRLIFQGHAQGWKDGLSAFENLRWQLSLDQYGTAPTGDQALEAALERCGIGQQRHLHFAVLSAGQRRRLAMSRLVLSLQGAGHQQRLCWLLDEPSTALDDQGQALMGSLLTQLLHQGGFAIIATHGAIPNAPTAAVLQLSA